MYQLISQLEEKEELLKEFIQYGSEQYVKSVFREVVKARKIKNKIASIGKLTIKQVKPEFKNDYPDCITISKQDSKKIIELCCSGEDKNYYLELAEIGDSYFYKNNFGIRLSNEPSDYSSVGFSFYLPYKEIYKNM